MSKHLSLGSLPASFWKLSISILQNSRLQIFSTLLFISSIRSDIKYKENIYILESCKKKKKLIRMIFFYSFICLRDDFHHFFLCIIGHYPPLQEADNIVIISLKSSSFYLFLTRRILEDIKFFPLLIKNITYAIRHILFDILNLLFFLNYFRRINLINS